METYIAIVETVIAAILLVITIQVYRFNRKNQRLSAFEQNFDVLQRLNQLALSSEKNVIAAVKSVRTEDDIGADEARIVFFHFLRINRMLRAWKYRNEGVISNIEYQEIIENYAGTLKEAKEEQSGKLIDALKQRGYPRQFMIDLSQAIDSSDYPTRFDEIIATGKNR